MGVTPVPGLRNLSLDHKRHKNLATSVLTFQVVPYQPSVSLEAPEMSDLYPDISPSPLSLKHPGHTHDLDYRFLAAYCQIHFSGSDLPALVWQGLLVTLPGYDTGSPDSGFHTQSYSFPFTPTKRDY